MDYKMGFGVFVAVFVAELGDKTQLATLLFATDRDLSKLMVFVAASLALICTSGLGVLAGGLIAEYISPRALHLVAGLGFIGIGVWTILKA